MTDWALGVTSRQVPMRLGDYRWTATVVEHHAVRPSPTEGPPVVVAVCGETVHQLPIVWGVQQAFDAGFDLAHRRCVALVRGLPVGPDPPAVP